MNNKDTGGPALAHGSLELGGNPGITYLDYMAGQALVARQGLYRGTSPTPEYPPAPEGYEYWTRGGSAKPTPEKEAAFIAYRAECERMRDQAFYEKMAQEAYAIARAMLAERDK